MPQNEDTLKMAMLGDSSLARVLSLPFGLSVGLSRQCHCILFHLFVRFSLQLHIQHFKQMLTYTMAIVLWYFSLFERTIEKCGKHNEKNQLVKRI